MKNTGCPHQRKNKDPYGRFGKKRYQPFKKKRKDAFENRHKEASRKDAFKRACSPEETDSLGIFLDDERSCPEGWLLARTPAEFFNTLHSIDTRRLTQISLDWHLGPGQPNGEEIATILADPEADHFALIKNVTHINCHSSDMERAYAMIRILEKAFPDVIFGVGTPGKMGAATAMRVSR